MARYAHGPTALVYNTSPKQTRNSASAVVLALDIAHSEQKIHALGLVDNMEKHSFLSRNGTVNSEYRPYYTTPCSRGDRFGAS